MNYRLSIDPDHQRCGVGMRLVGGPGSGARRCADVTDGRRNQHDRTKIGRATWPPAFPLGHLIDGWFHRVAAYRMMDELMGTKIPSQDGLKRGEALIAILLLSLCMWPVVWELASAVLRYL